MIPGTRKKKGRKFRQKLHTRRPVEGQVYRGTKPETICRQMALGETRREHWGFQKQTNRKADYRGWHVSRTVVTGYKFLHFVSEFQHLSQWGATWEQVTLLRADLGTEKPFKLPL